MRVFCKLFQVIFLVSFFLFMAGCKAGREMRKTLPDAGNVDLDNSFVPAVLPFYATDTSIDGKKFTAIYLRNSAYDSLAFNIVQSYEPFAESVLTMLAQQHIKGVLIDFRQNNEQDLLETAYQISRSNTEELTREKNTSVTIRFAWDDASTARAAGFIEMLTHSNHLSATEINSINSLSPKDQNCFTETRPGFGDN